MKILLLSDVLTTSDLIQPPFNLHPDTFTVTRLKSIQWISLSQFVFIILHTISNEDLRKVSLGIHDSLLLDSLWKILYDLDKKIYLLVDFKDKGLNSNSEQSYINRNFHKLLFDLGIDVIKPNDIIILLENYVNSNEFKKSERFNFNTNLITADDIRTAKINNITDLYISSNHYLTDWAKEVANALGIRLVYKNSSFLLYKLKINSLNDLFQSYERIINLCDQYKDIHFLLTPCIIPVFIELFPNLKRKIVSSSIHWEESGAYTGEISINMLIDLGCKYGILKNSAPYNYKENVNKLLQIAKSKNFVIISEIPPQDLEKITAPEINLEAYTHNLAFIKNSLIDSIKKESKNNASIYENKYNSFLTVEII